MLGKKYTSSITIGEGTVIQRNCFLSAINKIEIGKNVAITERTLIVDNVHGEFRDHKFTFENDTNIPDVFLLSFFYCSHWA